MKTTLARIVLAPVLAALLTTIAAADHSVLSRSDATLMGLEQAWGKTLQAGAGVDRLVDIVLHVDKSRAQKYIDIYDGEKLVWRNPTDRLDPRTGKEMGEEMVRKQAARELIFLKARGIKGEVKEKVVPYIWLYALGADGTVEAVNAETGETKWVNRAGNPRHPKFELAVDDRNVTFTSGATLIQFNAIEGDLVNVEPCETVPIAGGTIAGDFILLPTTGGGMEGHYIDDITEKPYHSMVSGEAAARATPFPKGSMVAWPTRRNRVYCMEASGEPTEMFVLETDGAVTGRVEAVGRDLLYFCSQGGFVYGYKANRVAKPLWQVSTGEPMVGDTIALGKNIYATSAYGNLYALDASTGERAWRAPAPRIKRVLGAIGDALMVCDTNSKFTVLSALSGARAATARESTIHSAIVNDGTDRVYLVSSSGFVQCLRPIGRELPEVSIEVKFKEPEKEETKNEKAKAPAANKDPFGGGGADPFGAGGGADPFGAAAGADPFGAPAGGAPADDDPFGGNPF